MKLSAAAGLVAVGLVGCTNPPPPDDEPVSGDTVRIAQDQASPCGVALARGEVFFIDRGDGYGQGAVLRADIDGADVTRVADGIDYPAFIAADDGGLTFVSQGPVGGFTILRAGYDGGAITGLASLASLRGFAVARGRAFFTDLDRGVIESVSLEGGDIAVLAEGQDQIGAVAATSDALYWSVASGMMRMALDGREAPELVFEGDAPDAISASDEAVAFTTRGGDVFVLERGATRARRVFAGQAEEGLLGVLAVDGREVIFFDSAEGTLDAVPLQGGAPRVLAEDQTSVVAIALDEDAVYWADLDGGFVARASRQR